MTDTDTEAEDEEEYGIAEVVDLEEMPAPALPYRPDDPETYDPNIALVGTGGISDTAGCNFAKIFAAPGRRNS